jgi:predicted 3-demethylubiquinone-9 3-methyltransferase (glyoxalase superfamily)
MEAHIKPEPLEVLKGIEKQKIVPFLWFDHQAEEAANYYASVFKNARVKTITRYNEESAAAAGMPKDTVLTVAFQIEGVDFTALNGGPVFKMSPAISFMVNCRTAEKINELWSRLSDGGTVRMEIGKYPFSERYGWVEDKYGVNWQLIMSDDSQNIAPSIMFTGDQQGKCEEAINYYMSIFKYSSIERIERYTDEDMGPTGMVKYAAFSINGQNFKAMDSGMDVPFRTNPSISFVVNCESQQEIDYFWERLTLGGDEQAQQCGWLADRYGVSWQIVPEKLGLWISDHESEKGKQVMGALMQMKKIDMNVLEDAYEGYHINRESDADYNEIGSNYEGPDKSYRRQETMSPNEEL